jgi:hypothetical protein
VLKIGKTFTALTLAVIFALFLMGMASAAPSDNSTSTVTPTAEPSLTPTPNATVTPVPTPAPRQVFSSPKWNVDHETIVVTNNGAAITIVAWVDDPTNNLKYEVDSGSTKTISTPSILAQDGQIVNCGFQAYEDQTLIESRNFTITLDFGPTPTALPPESVTVSGTIVDADNGTPIAGATVTFKSITYDKAYPIILTGSDGTYVTPKMYPDEYSIKVTASGYQGVSRTTEKIVEDSTLDSIGIKHIGGTPTPPSPTYRLVDIAVI